MSTAVNFKGTRQGIVIKLEGTDFESLKQMLNHKINSSKEFFQGAEVHLENAAKLDREQTTELEQICREHGLVPAIYEPSKTVNNPKAARPGTYGLLPEELDIPCRLVTSTVRSGQSLNSNGHLVILGDVNPGAEVSAVGSVIVFGNLRGTARAGMNGDTNTFVAARICYPSQVQIGGIPGRAGKMDQTPVNMEKAVLREERICIEPLSFPEN